MMQSLTASYPENYTLQWVSVHGTDKFEQRVMYPLAYAVGGGRHGRVHYFARSLEEARRILAVMPRLFDVTDVPAWRVEQESSWGFVRRIDADSAEYWRMIDPAWDYAAYLALCETTASAANR